MNKFKKIEKVLRFAGDKSISHRALMFSSLVRGKTKIDGFLNSQDTLITLSALRRLGVEIKKKRSEVIVQSQGKLSFNGAYLYMGESGTSLRLLAGILAAAGLKLYLRAAFSLRRRPMSRIAIPLRQMGAKIYGRKDKGYEFPPLLILPAKRLKGIDYQMPQASAQVKSAIIFAALKAKGITKIRQPFVSRDHTERMLKVFGGNISQRRNLITVIPSSLRTPQDLFVPGDFSSAAYFIALALLRPQTKFLLKDISLNPTRTGLLSVLRRMGAKLRIKRKNLTYFEPYGDIEVESSNLGAVVVKEEEVPLLIDELPLVFVLAAFASGKSVIYGLRELRVKETDRIYSLEYNLKRWGVRFRVFEYVNSQQKKDFYVEIEGAKDIRCSRIKSFSDHRTAMSLAVGALALDHKVQIDDWACVRKSFPDFYQKLETALNFS